MIMNTIFKADQEYLDNLHNYTVKDTCLALAFYIFNLVSLYIVGKIHSDTGNYHGEILAILTIAIVLLLVKLKVSKVGISKRGALPGIITGLIMGVIFIMSYTIIPGIIAGLTILPAKAIINNIFYYFIIIAFEEELSFRGFIQPRLFPLLKKEWITLIVGGIFFVFMHYPYQMAARGMNFIEYFPLFIAGAPLQLMWHFVFSWLYRRFGNIFGGTILHGFVDMSMGIFG
jgi:membrane protease YdiL (CAAX protease family)